MATTCSFPLPFLALQDNKIHWLNVLRSSLISVYCLVLRQKTFWKFFLGFWVCFCSQGINNFHNTRGHHEKISPRQQPITARDFESDLYHVINIVINTSFILDCNCVLAGVTNNGSCSQVIATIGQCMCNDNVTGRRCDRCNDTYYGYMLPPVGTCLGKCKT